MTEPLPRARPLLETELLHTFVVIADAGSFTHAGRHIHRTTSAVSMQVRRLEETLGLPLFRRAGRTVELTADGEALLGYARRILELNEQALGRFRSPKVEGRVRLGVPADFGTRFLPSLLARFAAAHPRVEIDVALAPSAELRRRLDRGELDSALVTVSGDSPDTKGAPIVHTERLVWVGLNGGRAATHSPLPLALSNDGCPWRTQALAALASANAPHRIAYNSEHSEGQLAALRADLAVAPLPESLVDAPCAGVAPDLGLPELGTYRIVALEGLRPTPPVRVLSAWLTGK